MPGSGKAHGIKSSVVVFPTPCVTMRVGGGSAAGSGILVGGFAGCASPEAAMSKDAATTSGAR